jgi:hypothetical protein
MPWRAEYGGWNFLEDTGGFNRIREIPHYFLFDYLFVYLLVYEVQSLPLSSWSNKIVFKKETKNHFAQELVTFVFGDHITYH